VVACKTTNLLLDEQVFFFVENSGILLPCFSLFLRQIEGMPRIIAIDYGTKRTGIAVTDELQMIASGLTTVETRDLMKFLKEYLETEHVESMVIGEPKRMNNEASDVEVDIVRFRESVEKQHPQLTIIRQDERFTSKMAFQTMIDSGIGKKKRQNKALVDQISATIILQDYLYNR